RYASPQALVDDLKHWLADEPVGAWPEPWTVKARRWVGRNRTLVTAAAAALLVGIVSLAVANVLLAQANEVIQGKNDELTRANTSPRRRPWTRSGSRRGCTTTSPGSTATCTSSTRPARRWRRGCKPPTSGCGSLRRRSTRTPAATGPDCCS